MVRSALLALLVAFLAFAGGAAAHSDPRGAEADFSEPPGVLRVALDAPVEERGLTATLDLEGITIEAEVRRDPDDPAAILVTLSPLRPARQEVSWSGLSTDGHLASGSVVVGSPVGLSAKGDIGPVSSTAGRDGLVLLLGRGLSLAGLVVALGLLIFEIAVVRPVWQRGGVRPPVGALGAERVRRAGVGAMRLVRRQWWRVWWGALLAGIVGLVLWTGALMAGVGGSVGDLAGLFTATRPGQALVLVAVGALGAVAGSALVSGRDAFREPALPAATAPLLCMPLTLCLVGFSWGGHAGTGADWALDVVVDLVHSGATAAWFGGLLGLALILRRGLRKIEGRPQLALAAGFVVRFSGLAMVAVGLLTLSGIYRALGELQELSDLTTTDWGRWLLLKIALFVLMLAIASVNRFVLHVRLERAALGLAADDRSALSALRSSVRSEVALAVAVLITVAGLIATAPPV